MQLLTNNAFGEYSRRFSTKNRNWYSHHLSPQLGLKYPQEDELIVEGPVRPDGLVPLLRRSLTKKRWGREFNKKNRENGAAEKKYAKNCPRVRHWKSAQNAIIATLQAWIGSKLNLTGKYRLTIVHLPARIVAGGGNGVFMLNCGLVLPLILSQLLGIMGSLSAEENKTEGTTTVRIRLVQGDTGQTLPGMVCISDNDGQVRLPPDGQIAEKMSDVNQFKRGIAFHPDRNWIGPVRSMRGRHNNNIRAEPYQLAPSIPYWEEPASYQTSGDFTIRLPAGNWRLAVDHGVEYIPVVKQFELRGQQDRNITIKLQRWINMPQRGWWSGDVHVHRPTEKPAHREFLLQFARAVDLHVVNVLAMGHHQGIDFPQEGFGKKFRTERGDYALVSGQEDPRSTFGHIIGVNLTNMVRDLSTYDLYDMVFHGIHEQPDALVGFAHFS